MKNLIYISILFLLTLSSCNKDDSNPLNNNSTSLNGTWKTNGIYVDMNPNRGVQMTVTFDNGTYVGSSITYTKDSLGNWQQQSSDNDAGAYTLDNSFIILGNEDGSILHYSIDGNKLTLNSTADAGGIYHGSSNSLTNQNWQINYNTSKRTYFYNTNGTGIFLYDYLNGRIDSTFFNYIISSNIITHNYLYRIINGQQYQETGSYLGIYEIKDNKFYMYGKPYTEDNDNYFIWILFKQ